MNILKKIREFRKNWLKNHPDKRLKIIGELPRTVEKNDISAFVEEIKRLGYPGHIQRFYPIAFRFREYVYYYQPDIGFYYVQYGTKRLQFSPAEEEDNFIEDICMRPHYYTDPYTLR